MSNADVTSGGGVAPVNPDALAAIRRCVRFIGGGTCAGKTTLGRSLASTYGVPLFSVDDRLWDYAALAKRAGSTVANNVTETDFERFWMRDPELQFQEMRQFYDDVFPFVLADLAEMAEALLAAGPTNADAPGQLGKPDQAGQAGHPDLPGQPDQSDQPDRPDRPGRLDRPGQPGQPGQASQLDQPGQPNRSDRPGQTDRPDQPDEPRSPGNPDEQHASNAQPSSANGVDQTRDGKLAGAGRDLLSGEKWINGFGLHGQGPVLIAEGIAFLPSLLHGIGIPRDHCVFLTVERGVHVQRYGQRDWARLMLEGCSDPDRAFDLWMARDELFAESVRAECAALGYSHIPVG